MIPSNNYDTFMPRLNLKSRRRQPELMDQPGLDMGKHRSALAGLQRVNSMSRTGRVFWRELQRLVHQRQLAKLRLLDLACGGGDLAIWLARQGQRSGLDVTVCGYDISPTAVAYAKEKSLAAGVGNAQFYECDALNESLEQQPGEAFDIVFSTLFLHHLEEPQATLLLQRMAAKARHAVIVDDLRRTRFGYGLAWIGCRLLTRSPIVHVDGPLSVQAAFTVDEARSLAGKAGLQNVSITTHWPQRFLLTWQRP